MGRWSEHQSTTLDRESTILARSPHLSAQFPLFNGKYRDAAQTVLYSLISPRLFENRMILSSADQPRLARNEPVLPRLVL